MFNNHSRKRTSSPLCHHHLFNMLNNTHHSHTCTVVIIVFFNYNFEISYIISLLPPGFEEHNHMFFTEYLFWMMHPTIPSYIQVVLLVCTRDVNSLLKFCTGGKTYQREPYCVLSVVHIRPKRRTFSYLQVALTDCYKQCAAGGHSELILKQNPLGNSKCLAISSLLLWPAGSK